MKLKAFLYTALLSAVASLVVGTTTYGITLEGRGWDNFFVGVGLFFWALYFHFYKPNVKAHLSLLDSFGQEYQKIYEQCLKERNLFRLLMDKWFVKQLAEMNK